jgi:hypothetical protein
MDVGGRDIEKGRLRLVSSRVVGIQNNIEAADTMSVAF